MFMMKILIGFILFTSVEIFAQLEDKSVVVGNLRWDRKEINVCWEDNTADYNAYKSKLQLLIQKEFTNFSNLNFVYWKDCKNVPERHISIGDYTPPNNSTEQGRSLNGKASFGVPFSMKINFSGLINTDSSIKWHLESVFLHEFYHAAGGMHDHDRPGSLCPYAYPIAEGVYHNNMYIGLIDPYSISNYCRLTTEPKFSPFDALGLAYLYGFPQTAEFKQLMNKAIPLGVVFSKQPDNFPVVPDSQVKGDFVLWLQMRLAMENSLNFNKHDMEFGLVDSDALKSFQLKKQLQVTGTLTEETWLYINNEKIQ